MSANGIRPVRSVTQLAPIAFELVKLLRDEHQCTADDAMTALVLAAGQLIARHFEAGTAREAYEGWTLEPSVFRVFEIAWVLQKREQQGKVLL